MTSEGLNTLFREKGLTLGSVESFTGGAFASSIVAVSGASKFYKGGLVTYASEEKVRLLGISQSDVDKYGVVSKEIALQMAKLGKEKLATDYCVSFTGNAGPEVMENKPVGLIYIGIATPKETKAYEFQLEGNRNKIQKSAIDLAYTLLEKAL